MKKMLIFLLTLLSLGVASQAQDRPRYIYIAGQKTEDFYALQFTEHGQKCTLTASFRNYTNLCIVARR